MKKRDIAILLFPSTMFIVVAVTAFLTCKMISHAERDDGGQQKFDTFVSNVQSGKWQLTTDKWLEGMRLEHKTAESLRMGYFDIADIMRDIGEAPLVGILFQTATVFYVRKKFTKHSSQT